MRCPILRRVREPGVGVHGKADLVEIGRVVPFGVWAQSTTIAGFRNSVERVHNSLHNSIHLRLHMVPTKFTIPFPTQRLPSPHPIHFGRDPLPRRVFVVTKMHSVSSSHPPTNGLPLPRIFSRSRMPSPRHSPSKIRLSQAGHALVVSCEFLA